MNAFEPDSRSRREDGQTTYEVVDEAGLKVRSHVLHVKRAAVAPRAYLPESGVFVLRSRLLAEDAGAQADTA